MLAVFEIIDRSQKMKAYLLMLFMLLTGIFDAVGIASIIPFVTILFSDDVGQSQAATLLLESVPFVNDTNLIIYLGLGGFLIYVMSVMVKSFTTFLSLRFAFHQQHLLSQKLLETYINQKYTWFLKRNSAEIGKNILDEINATIHSGLMPFLNLCASAAVTLALLLLLIIIDVFLTLCVLGLLGGIYFLIFIFSRNFVESVGHARLQENERRFRTIGEAFLSIKLVKSQHLENFFSVRFATASEKFSRYNAVASIVAVLPRFGVEAIIFGGILGLTISLKISNTVTPEIITSLTVFAFAGYRLLPAIQQVYGNLSSVIFASPTIKLLAKELRSVKTLHGKNPKNIRSLTFNHEIQLSKLTFRYPEQSQNVLKNISFDIRAGSVIGIVGATGSGKTTLLDIMLGISQPTSGEILVDNVKLDKRTVGKWQDQVGFVPQDVRLFDGTIAENIAFGVEVETINRQRLQKAAELAHIDELIEKNMELGFDTELGENGSRLSGGQKQRIGLARAFYRCPSILLLDEPTSALDNVTELKVMKTLRSQAGKVTVVMVTHRQTTMKLCDQILVMENGGLVAHGTYEDLIGTCGAFQKLVN